MLTTPDGRLAVQAAAASVPAQGITRTVIAIRREHDERYGGQVALRRAFGAGIDVVVLDRDTNGPAETIAAMVEQAGVGGPILIKDADSFFAPSALPSGTSVAVTDLRRALAISRVGAKSFVVLNEHGLVVDIVEKDVSSNYVSSGLYGFASASLFMSCIAEVRPMARGEIFVSHVIAEALRRGEVVRPHVVESFVDVGTLTDWRDYTAQRRTYFVDIDGVVFENQSGFFPPFWDSEPTPIAANVTHLRTLQDRGGQLVFVTSRPETLRTTTAAALEAVGLAPHALVMGCAHAGRVLINDFADSNPYPSAVAVNIARNRPDLHHLLPQ